VRNLVPALVLYKAFIHYLAIAVKSIIGKQGSIVAVHAAGFGAEQVQPSQFAITQYFSFSFEEPVEPAFGAADRSFKFSEGSREGFRSYAGIAISFPKQFTVFRHIPDGANYGGHLIVHL
jgi:hypothetical protein